MTVIASTLAYLYAQQAGFRGQSLTTIVDIAQAESSLDTTRYNPKDPYGGSYGILQINGSHMGESFQYGNHSYMMSPSVADNPQLAFAFAYQLSQGGTNFTEWGAYTSGAYLDNTAQLASPLSSTSPLASSSSLGLSSLSDPTVWERVGIGMVGIVTIITGTYAIVASFEGGMHVNYK